MSKQTLALALAALILVFAFGGVTFLAMNKAFSQIFTIQPYPKQPAKPKDNSLTAREPGAKFITLREASTISIREEVTDTNMAALSEELMEKSRALPENSVIYLVLDTPGGDVLAGDRFLAIAKAIPQKVKTITVYSASMGFHIAQNLDERLILENGTMMSHRMKISGIGGQVPGEAESRLKYIQELGERHDKICAKRMEMSFEAYRNLIRDEYYAIGAKAVETKSADQVVYAKCDATFKGSTVKSLRGLFGIEIKTEVSKCPLISSGQ